jgi:hypothetical protein
MSYSKYYLAEIILIRDILTADLKEEILSGSIEELFNMPISTEVLYDNRVGLIKTVIDSHIKEIDTITGVEALELTQQRDDILQRLQAQRHYVLNILIPNGDTFADILEQVLGTDMTGIRAYREAEKLLTGTRIVPVILDGNNTPLMIDGERRTFGAEVTDNRVTMDVCHKAVARLTEFNCHPGKLEFLLSIYTSTPGNEYGDFPEECLLDRKAYYHVAENRLMIWENGDPVYEDNNGIVCTDTVALSDCYC